MFFKEKFKSATAKKVAVGLPKPVLKTKTFDTATFPKNSKASSMTKSTMIPGLFLEMKKSLKMNKKMKQKSAPQVNKVI